MRAFEFLEPNTLEELLRMLDRYGNNAKILAGGTDLVVQMKQNSISPGYVISLRSIPHLDLLAFDGTNGLRIGPMVTHSALLQYNEVQEKYPIIIDSCLAVGTPQIRNRGTLVGNICNANPSADTIPSLIVLDSAIKVRSLKQERTIPVESYFEAPYLTRISTGELVTEIVIPTPPAKSGGAYVWLPKATAVDETLVGCAALIRMKRDDSIFEEVKIALAAVGPTPFRAKKAENFLIGKRINDEVLTKTGEIACDESSPIARFGISEVYRKKMVKVLVKRSIKKAVERL